MIRRADHGLSILIPGRPVPQGRGRSVPTPRGRRVKDPDRSAQFKRSAKVYMLKARSGSARPFPVDQPVAVVLRFYYAGTRVEAYWKRTGPDIDNLTKAILDAANGTLWVDDRQVAQLVAEKRFAAQGEMQRTEMEVYPL